MPLVVLANVVGDLEGFLPVALGQVQTEPVLPLLEPVGVHFLFDGPGLGKTAIVDERNEQDLQMMTVLIILPRLYALQFVVGAFQLDGPRRAVGGLGPAADARGQVGLHMERMRDAGRGLDVILGIKPAEGRPAKAFVEVHQLMIGPGVERVDAQQGLVEGHCCNSAAGQLGAVVPCLLVLVVHGQQAIDGADGRLPARLAVADAGHLPFVLQAGQDQLRLAIAGPPARRRP